MMSGSMVLGLSERTCREPTLAEQLIYKKPTTEVGPGLETLGVTLILAPYRTHSKKEGFRHGQLPCSRLNRTDQPDIIALPVT